MTLRNKCLLGLLVLSCVDAVVIVPVVGLLLGYVVWARPTWFPALVDEIYHTP